MPTQPGQSQLPPRHVLVATDFSPHAEDAMRWADALRGAFGAQLYVLHVIDMTIAGVAGLPAYVPHYPVVGELVSRLTEEAATEMAGLAARYPHAKTIVREGYPRSTILQVAEEFAADLIVLGTHGRTGLAHVLLGSVAEHIVRHSRFPVLTVRTTEPI